MKKFVRFSALVLFALCAGLITIGPVSAQNIDWTGQFGTANSEVVGISVDASGV